jgi:hypothetical protein
MDYARKGSRAFAAENYKGAGIDTEGRALGPSRFEAFVADSLRKLGWEVEVGVGVSEYRVSLGIVDPRNTKRYLAGVECDGEAYRKAATAMDRDVLRGSVLSGLGWTIFRAWAPEWWRKPTEEAARLDEKLKGLLDQPLNPTEDLSGKDTPIIGPGETSKTFQGADSGPSGENTPGENNGELNPLLGASHGEEGLKTDTVKENGGDKKGEDSLGEDEGQDNDDVDDDDDDDYGEEGDEDDDGIEDGEGTPTNIDEGGSLEITPPYDDESIKLAIAKTIDDYAPIIETRLAMEVAKKFERKAGKTFRTKIIKIAQRNFPTTKELKDPKIKGDRVKVFFWKENAGLCDSFRKRGPKEKKNILEIAIEELRALARTIKPEILDNPVDLMRDALGLSKLGADSRTRLQSAWDTQDTTTFPPKAN